METKTDDVKNRQQEAGLQELAKIEKFFDLLFLPPDNYRLMSTWLCTTHGGAGESPDSRSSDSSESESLVHDLIARHNNKDVVIYQWGAEELPVEIFPQAKIDELLQRGRLFTQESMAQWLPHFLRHVYRKKIHEWHAVAQKAGITKEPPQLPEKFPCEIIWAERRVQIRELLIEAQKLADQYERMDIKIGMGSQEENYLTRLRNLLSGSLNAAGSVDKFFSEGTTLWPESLLLYGRKRVENAKKFLEKLIQEAAQKAELAARPKVRVEVDIRDTRVWPLEDDLNNPKKPFLRYTDDCQSEIEGALRKEIHVLTPATDPEDGDQIAIEMRIRSRIKDVYIVQIYTFDGVACEFRLTEDLTVDDLRRRILKGIKSTGIAVRQRKTPDEERPATDQELDQLLIKFNKSRDRKK